MKAMYYITMQAIFNISGHESEDFIEPRIFFLRWDA
jgi:hypothetical protein